MWRIRLYVCVFVCVMCMLKGFQALAQLIQALCHSVCIMVTRFVVCLHFIKTTASAIIFNDEEVIFFPLFHCSQHLEDEACHNRTSCTGHKNKNLSLCGKETDCIRFLFWMNRSSFEFGATWPFWNRKRDSVQLLYSYNSIAILSSVTKYIFLYGSMGNPQCKCSE